MKYYPLNHLICCSQKEVISKCNFVKNWTQSQKCMYLKTKLSFTILGGYGCLQYMYRDSITLVKIWNQSYIFFLTNYVVSFSAFSTSLFKKWAISPKFFFFLLCKIKSSTYLIFGRYVLLSKPGLKPTRCNHYRRQNGLILRASNVGLLLDPLP